MKKLKAKKEEVKASVMGVLNETDIFELKVCLENVNVLEEQVKWINSRIASLVNEKDVRRISKVPGMGEVSASAVMAEIGDPKRFQNDKQLASYAGLVPSTHQTVGKTAKTGHITKQGSRWLRRILAQCAMIAIRARNSQLRLFYLRVRGKRGHNVAIIAVAKKLLKIVWQELSLRRLLIWIR